MCFYELCHHFFLINFVWYDTFKCILSTMNLNLYQHFDKGYCKPRKNASLITLSLKVLMIVKTEEFGQWGIKFPVQMTRIGLIQLKEEELLGFSEGLQGCSEGNPEE